LAADGGDGGLVAGVNIGTLVAIDFDGNESPVDDFRDLGIVVRLAIHDVTPVTPYSADVEKDGLVLRLGARKSFVAPLVPANRLVHGGTQVSGRRLGELVGRCGTHRDSVRQRRKAKGRGQSAKPKTSKQRFCVLRFSLCPLPCFSYFCK
jgi:hypothetical protein